MRINLIILSLFMLFSGYINAQSDFRPGYIIKNTGDTIFGEIDYRGDQLMSEICRFKSSLNDSVTRYKPDEILSYRITDDKYFVSKKYKDKYSFYEFLINGILDAYYIRDAEGDHYYIEKEESGLIDISYSEKIITKDNNQYVSKSKKHLGLLSFYMQDAPTIQNKILLIKKPQHKNLIKLAETYHNEVCTGEKCIIYQKEIPSVELSSELFLGYEMNKIYDRSYLSSGALVYLSLPRMNEKLYFKTGFIYNITSAQSNFSYIYKFPVQIQYIYPAKRLKPKIAIGINILGQGANINVGKEEVIYAYTNHTSSFNLGFNYKLNKNLSFSSNFFSEYSPLMFTLFGENYTLKILSYSFNLGLYYEF